MIAGGANNKELARPLHTQKQISRKIFTIRGCFLTFCLRLFVILPFLCYVIRKSAEIDFQWVDHRFSPCPKWKSESKIAPSEKTQAMDYTFFNFNAIKLFLQKFIFCHHNEALNDETLNIFKKTALVHTFIYLCFNAWV